MLETLAAPPKTATNCVVLHDISWKLYESMLEELDESHVKLTYDRGTLEIMSPGRIHDFGKKLIARLIESMADELYIDIVSGGSTTCRREDLAKGLVPDELYYIKNAQKLLNQDPDLDLTRDPPPDLALETDVTSHSIDREPIYAALGVPELWRCVDSTVEFRCLDRHKKYRPRERSLSFPFLSSRDLRRFLQMRGKVEERKIVRLFRAFVRPAAEKK